MVGQEPLISYQPLVLNDLIISNLIPAILIIEHDANNPSYLDPARLKSPHLRQPAASKRRHLGCHWRTVGRALLGMLTLDCLVMLWSESILNDS